MKASIDSSSRPCGFRGGNVRAVKSHTFEPLQAEESSEDEVVAAAAEAVTQEPGARSHSAPARSQRVRIPRKPKAVKAVLSRKVRFLAAMARAQYYGIAV